MTRRLVEWVLEAILLAGGIVLVGQIVDHGLKVRSWTATWSDFWTGVPIALVVLLIIELFSSARKAHRAQ